MWVSVQIFNMLGVRVAEPVVGFQQLGDHSFRWDGIDAAGFPVASGVYVYRIEAGPKFVARKMVLVR
jgi:flagellar hook assembly protein FlgD